MATPTPTTSTMSSTTAPSSSASASSSNPGSPSNNSSPLLFFVALGFGVVFTNLWIIVGVKYCFRYNQRNRALRAHADGDPIDLTAMPRPHRRRREKKLMTMDEVNSKFPLMKYKAWRASREQEGLPTAGGISVPPSRAASIKDAEGAIGRKSQEVSRPLSSLSHALAAISNRPTSVADNEITETRVITKMEPGEKTAMKEEVTAGATITEKSKLEKRISANAPAGMPTASPVLEEDDDEDIDPIEHAHSSEVLCAQPGDTCAICLDGLDDDDDVRGLTCGHAFHAACVDPWLSTRRACCPLCKADYYTPKPRPEGEEAAATAAAPGQAQRGSPVHGARMNLPQQPQRTWLGGRSRFLLMAVGGREAQQQQRRGQSGGPPPSSSSRQARPQPQTQASQIGTPVTRRVGPNPFGWFRRNNNSTAQQPAQQQTQEPTPRQLEAGTR